MEQWNLYQNVMHKHMEFYIYANNTLMVYHIFYDIVIDFYSSKSK